MLWRNLEGGDIPDDSRFSEAELEKYIRGGLAQAMKQSFYEQLNVDSYRYGDDSISITYTVPVLKDTGEYGILPYITLPADSISIPGGRSIDITDANPVSRNATTYLPQRVEEVFVGKFQPQVPCVVLYYMEGDKVVFFNGTVGSDEVRVRQRYAIPKDKDQELNFPQDFQNVILAEAIRLCNSEIKPQDRANDGVPIEVR